MLGGLARGAAVALAFAIPVAAAPGAGPATAQIRPPAPRSIDTLIRRQMAEGRIPGLQIAIVRNGRIVFSNAYGLASVEHSVAVRPDTLFPINSATKSFTGVAALQLAKAGKLDLDAPISRYLEDLPPAWGIVRVRQLLSHSSGLPNIVDGEGLIGRGGEQEAWEAVKALPREAEPGARFAYNQTNYALLARILSRQSGVAFTDDFSKNQFAPAKMVRTGFGDTFDVTANSATPYSYYRRVRGKGEIEGATLARWVDDLPPFMRTAGGINTTAGEVARWLIALQGGQLGLDAADLSALWRADRFADGSSGPWAMGWPVLATMPRRIVGGLGGGRAAFFVYPDDGLAIVVLTNLVGANPQRFIGKIADLYLGAPTG